MISTIVGSLIGVVVANLFLSTRVGEAYTDFMVEVYTKIGRFFMRIFGRR